MAALLVASLAACGGQAAAPTPTEAPGVRVPRAGDDWPFTVADGYLACMPDGGASFVYLVVGPDEHWYGLNGHARGSGLIQDARDLLTPGMVPADTQWLIDEGLELC